MSMVRFVATPESRHALERFIQSLERLPDTQASEFEIVRQAVRQGFAVSFVGEGSGRGQWAQLAPSTVAERILFSYPGEHPILVRSGDYQASFVDPSHPDHVSEVERGGVVTLIEGTAHLFVGTHEYGRDDVFHVPARPVLLLDPTSEDAVAAELDALFDRLAEF
jgi:phage gpG-like protein